MASLSRKASAATGVSTDPSTDASAVKISSGIASGARNAHKRSSSRILLFNSLKGERPCGGNWLRVISDEPSTLLQQLIPMLLIHQPIAHEIHTCLFQICSSLIQSQWQPTHFLCNIYSHFSFHW